MTTTRIAHQNKLSKRPQPEEGGVAHQHRNAHCRCNTDGSSKRQGSAEYRTEQQRQQRSSHEFVTPPNFFMDSSTYYTCILHTPNLL